MRSIAGAPAHAKVDGPPDPTVAGQTGRPPVRAGHPLLKRGALVLAAWLPFFAVWVLFARLYARYDWPAALATSLNSMGSASLLGLGVWWIAQRWPWPLRLGLGFYLRHIGFAAAYSASWCLVVHALEVLRLGEKAPQNVWSSPILGWQLLMGAWLYGLFAGVSYAVQTRGRLHEKELLAARARLEAIHARLHPHFLFNALHTLGALVKFQPEAAPGALERLGDLLRYALKEDGRELVEFGEEAAFTRKYLEFEQLRYAERMQVSWSVEPAAEDFDLLPFSLQALAENAVQHAIASRSEGGRIWIRAACRAGRLHVSVRDDGPGRNGASAPGAETSPQFGLRALRERLQAAHGPEAELRTESRADGYEAELIVPLPAEP